MLNVIDDFTREWIAIRIGRRLRLTDVIDVPSDVFILRGTPGHIRSDSHLRLHEGTKAMWGDRGAAGFITDRLEALDGLALAVVTLAGPRARGSIPLADLPLVRIGDHQLLLWQVREPACCCHGLASEAQFTIVSTRLASGSDAALPGCWTASR